MKLKYAIIGAGALGGYYGAMLAKAGKDVHFLLNSDYTYVKENGLKVQSVNGDFEISNPNVYSNSKDMPVCDIVCVCLKTTNNHLLKDILPPLLKTNTVVVLIQNGLGIEHELQMDFPNIQIGGGLAYLCSNKTSPGLIEHLDFGRVTFGAFTSDCNQQLTKVVEDFKEAGLPSDLAKDLGEARWRKLVWNIPFNGLAVALNTTTDAIMKDPSSRQLAKDLMLEVIAGANACGFAIEKEFADNLMVFTDKMKPYAPSMKLDFDFKRPLEVRTIYTNPVETAKNAGFFMAKVNMLEQQLFFIQNRFSEVSK